MLTLKQIMAGSLAAITLCASNTYAQSRDLLSLFESAAEYDAGIAAAKSAYLAEKQNEDIALANLLPSLNASATTGDNNDNSNIQPDQNYKNTAYSVSLN